MKTEILHLLLYAAVSLTPFTSAAVAPDAPPVFQEVFNFPLGDYWCEPNRLSAVDVDGDGRKDIVLMATRLTVSEPPWSYQARVILLRAKAEGGYEDSVITNFPGRYGYGAVTADLNNDGSPDLILREQSATHVLLNNGHGVFREVWTGQPGYYSATTVDANRDGFLDIVSGTQTGHGGLIELLINDGHGTNFTKTWESNLYGSVNDSIETVLSVNLNGDDQPDIAARETYGGRLVAVFGSSNAVPFIEHSERRQGDRTFALAAGRINGDTLDDLAVYVGWGEVRVMVNNGGGSMSNSWTSPSLGQAAFNLALADFDGDGFDDVFVGTFGDGALRIYRNRPGNGFEPWWQGAVPGIGYTGSVADMNGDGAPDLIVGEKNSIRILLNQSGPPMITGLARVTNGMSLTWTSTPGKVYRVQFKTHLSESEWTDLSGDVSATSATATKIDETTSASAQRFYRVIKLP